MKVRIIKENRGYETHKLQRLSKIFGWVTLWVGSLHDCEARLKGIKSLYKKQDYEIVYEEEI